MSSILVPGLSVVAATVGLVTAMFANTFSTTPGWRDQRWFWLICLTAAAYSACNIVLTIPVSDEVVVWASQGNYFFIALHIAGWCVHASAHLHKPLGLVGRAALVFSLVLALSALVPGLLLTDHVLHHEVDWLDARYAEPEPTVLGQALIAAALVAFSFPVWRYLNARRSHPDGKAYVAGLLALVLAGLNDAVAGTGKAPIPYLLDLAFLFTISAIGLALIRRFVADAERLETLSNKLEVMVAARTNELATAQDALGKAERLAAVGRLAAGVAHEVNNPSVAVISNLTYLEDALKRDGKLPPDAIDAISDSREGMRRIARIVRQLLDTGRIANAAAASASTMDVARVVASAVGTAHAGPARGVRIVTNVPPGLIAAGDPMTIEQVVLNLIANSAQAIGVRRAEGTIAITAERSGGRVLVRVRDNGPGLTEEAVRRAFEPFFTTKPMGEGTGLGLSVSLGLARAAGGDLRIEHTSAEGTTMVIDLCEATEAPAVRGPTPVPRAAGRKHVLVVDDERAVRDGLRRMLAGMFDIDTAEGVQEAVARIETVQEGPFPYDAVLCDVSMPEGGAQSLWQWVNERKPQLSSHVVFITGGIADESAQEFLSHTGRPVMYKPLTLSALADAVLRAS